MGQRVESTIDRVIVFPGAAWVTRLARITVATRTEIVVGGLPPALDDDTVQIAAHGPARAADARLTVEVVAADDAGTDADREHHDRRRELAVATAELAHLRAALGALGGLSAATRGDRDQAAPAWADALAARLAVAETRATREAAVRTAIAAAERTAVEANRALTAAEHRRRQATTAPLPAGAVHKALAITIEPDGIGGEVTLELRYLVPGATWAPAYVVRLGEPDAAGELRLELRAAIAQATGEDWRGVAIEVSTASPQRWMELPELPALRIGRAQPPPARAGWRPPPPGTAELFVDRDRELGPPAPAPPPPGDGDELASDLDPLDPQAAAFFGGGASQERAASLPPMFIQTASLRKGGGGLLAGLGSMLDRAIPAPRSSASPPMSMPAPNRARMAAPSMASADSETADDVGAELTTSRELLAYGQLRMAGASEPGRGRLVPAARPVTVDPRTARAVDEAARRARATAAAIPPAGLTGAQPGVYDYAFAADARLDVPSDGGWHNLAVLARRAPVVVRHVAVPAIQPEVFRVAWFDNPLDAPVLAGPVDVYDRGELIVSSRLAETAPGGAVELGLGVDPEVKAARNARFREEAAGMLRGALKLVHEVTVTVENLSPRAVALEVRERLPQPAPDEEDVEVAVDRVTPAWEPWQPEAGRGGPPLRGGHRWRIALAPASKQELRLDYHVRIAQKHELVGGNRRES